MAATNDVEERLTLVDRDRVERAFKRTRQGCRILDPLAIAPGGGADLFEGRQFVEVDQRRLVAAHRLALRVHRAGRPPHRPPHRIVHDHEQHRQVMRRGGVVERHRIAEQMRAVAQCGDDQPVGRRELRAERRPAAPAEPRGRARPEIAAREILSAMLGH
jgi:hypothetical protein